ncbi:DUF1983 domain-containing protein [Klebsiella michiganensis]|uniref:TipJ family phage tail tip protein n=1 Tax=Klebsiella michiganensis TaxID=1134687 RepID=UPI0032D9FDED
MANNIIKGRKGGSSGQRTPTEQPDDLQSVAKAKILIALGEGEFAGELTGKDIYLDGTPLLNADGSENFSGVAWEFRPGTQAQKYIQGIPGTENEISVGTEISSETAWSHTFTNTQLSAVRIRLKWPSLMKQEDDGGVVGNTVKYAIDLQTDGGAWQTVLETAVTGKTTSGYERSHRIDLPQAGSTWTLRLRKVSPDANSVKIGDVMTLQSYTEVIDAKLRYPHTALLYIEFDSRQFNGSIPQISCEPRGRVIRVPDNYNPESREYAGTWTGGFKWAWTDNPAWIYYDIVVSDRFGLGNRLTSANISKWTLYQIAQYCDQMVPDGKGGDGMEPRYLCNVYVQERNDAYTVLRDFAAIFRGMTCWSGEQIVVQADMPRDVDFNYTRANIIGKPRYSSSTSKARYTNALVSWSDPANAYADAMEPAFVPELVSRYSFNQLEVTAIGCTRQSEAHRKGLWGILTNNKDRMVEIDVGLDGKIPQPGYIIGLADELLAGRVNGGRISAVNGRVITLDRDTDAKAGDRLQLNLPSGISQARTIQSVNGRRQVTVTTAYSETPEVECVWVIESDDLYVQQYRVIGVKDNNNATYTITGVAHDPDKFPRIDTGAIIDQRPVSVIPPGNQSPPENIVISSYSVVNQGISVETMQVHWNAVKDAISYEAQWRRNDGNWINVPRSSTTSFEVSGIYAGRYLARVRAINAAEVSSGWAYSEEKTLTGKIGLPSAPLALATTSLLHGVQLNWAFPEGSGDTQKTELQYSPNPNGNGAMALSDVAYPGKTYQQMGLQIAAMFWYRARIVDRIGNESPWTAWVQGMASDDISEYYDKLTDAIKDTEAWQEARRDIEETHKELTKTADDIREEVAQQVTDINQSIDDSITELRTQVDGQIADVNKTLAEGDAALKSQLQTVENSLKQSIAQTNTGWDKAVKQETADRIADVNAKAGQAADQLLNEKNERVAAIASTQQIIQNVNDSLATQMAQISAGTGEQFDSQVIWYFDNDREGWTSNGGTPSVVENGWLRPANHATDAYITSPGISISGSAYRFLKLRLKKTGTPAWGGQIRWRYEGQSFNDSRMLTVAEPDYDNSGRAVLSIQDIPWGSDGSKPVVQFRLDLTMDQSDDNFIIIDWIAVGRPTPGASTAALREESTARANADTAEATKRATLATQMRGTSESNNLADLRSGLLFQEMNARITADKAEVTARESLQTQFNNNKASVADELSSVSTAQSAQASKISGLETSLGKKADASAVQSLTQKVEQQGTTLTSQGNTLTSLSSRVGKTESGVAANSRAITGLQSAVSQQGDKLTSQGQSLTKLTNDLSTTNANINKKADATALQSLQNTVTQQGSTLSTQGNAITSLESSLNALDVGGTNQIPDSGSLARYGNVSAEKYNGNGVMAFTLKAGAAYRDLISIDLSAPVDGTEYVLSFYAKAAANGQKVRSHFYSPNSTKKSVSSQGNTFTNSDGLCDFTLTTEWQRYWVKWTQSTGSGSKKLIVARINPGSTDQTVYLSSPKFERGNMPTAWNEAPEDNASAAAVNALTSRVDSAEGTLTSQGQAITKLNNDVATTNGNVNKKADAAALRTLQNTVVQQGKTLSTNSSAITQMQNAITGINADEALSVSMPGNMISNASFENGLTGYTGTNSYSVVEKLQVPHSGTVALKITGMATPGQSVNFVKGNSYLIGVWAKQLNGTTDNGEGDNKIRVGGASGQPVFTKPFNNPTLDTHWKLISGTWKATESGSLFVSLHNRVTAGARYFDSFHVIDVTDRVNLEATSSALQTLQSTVKQQGDTLSAHTSSITKLESSLKTTNDNVARKADQTALNTLSGKVDTNTKGISAANTSITTLTAAVRAGNATSGDLITNPTFEPVYNQMGFTVVSATADGVPKGCPFGYAARLAARDHHPNFSSVAATVGDVYEISVLVACGAGSADFNIYIGTATTPNGGLAAPLSAGGNTKKTSEWTRATWRFTVTRAMVDRGYIRPFLQINQSGPNFGTIWYATDWHWRNITAAAKAQTTADATARAVDTLSNTVTQQGKDISSVGTRTTKLENGLKTTNDNVSKKADAQALQTLQNTVSQQGKTLSSQSGLLTELKNGLSTTNANVDGLRGMGGNIVENGDFSQGSACWGVQQNAQNPVTFGNFGDGAKGVKMVKTNNSTSPGVFVNNKRPVPVNGQRRYRYIVRARGVSGAKNMILRRWNYAGGKEGAYADKAFTLESAWKTYTWETAQSPTGVDAHAFGLYCHPSAAEIWIDSFCVFDITDEVDIAANSAAISSLNSRVTKTEDGIKTQSESITKLTNSLNTTNQNVAKKADSAALQTLQSTVNEQGKKIDSQSSSITSLTNTVNTVGRKGSNPWIDSTFETYADGQKLAGGSQVIVGTSFTGTRSLRVTRAANTNGNADQLIGSRQAIRDDAVYRVEFWAMMPASENPSTGWNCAVGFHSQDKSGANNWQPGVYVNEAGLGGRGKWVKFSGLAKNNKSGRTNAVIWISPRGANGANTPGYNLFIDNFVMTEVTDASAALDGVTATNTAVTSLTNRVKKAEDNIDAQGKALTSLKSEVNNKASASAVNELTTRVTKTEKTLATHTSQITGLTSSLKDKADASAVNKLTTRVTDAEGKLTSHATQIGTINSNLYGENGLNATVTMHGETLASNTNQLKSMYSVKVETNNGKKVGAGLVLGSDGSTSDMILYADRFSLFNRNSKTAVPVMIAEGNELYIDSARIKNGSIDTAKIKDATITSAKIAGALNSVNYDWATGKTGWCLNMNGDMMLNNGTFRGHIEATSGTFKGAVEANSFVGDIAAMGVFPAFNRDVKSRLIHHDTSNKGGKSFCIQGIVRWIAGNERSSIGIECWVNGQRVSRITFNTSDIGSSLIGYLPFQGTKAGISTQDTLVEIVITGSISASLVSGTCIMSRGSGNWENIG